MDDNVKMLQERVALLEQLLIEYDALIETIPNESTINSVFLDDDNTVNSVSLAWEKRRMQIQQRAKELLDE